MIHMEMFTSATKQQGTWAYGSDHACIRPVSSNLEGHLE